MAKKKDKNIDINAEIYDAIVEEELRKKLDNEKQEAPSDSQETVGESTADLFILPITRRPFFPGMATPIVIEPGPFYEILKNIANSPQKGLGLFLTKEEDTDPYSVAFDDIYHVGILAHILRILPLEAGGAQVILNIDKRITIDKCLETTPHMRAKVSIFDDNHEKVSQELKAYSINIISTIKDLLKLNPLFQEELQIFLGHSDFTEPGKLADFAVALTTASREELQEVLETFNTKKRITKALSLLRKEVDLGKIQSKINKKIEKNISKAQREFFLREQLKTIKKELGMEKDAKLSEIEKFHERISKRTIPNDVLNTINEELDKLQTLDSQSAEYGVCRNYLDWLTIVPWGLTTENTFTLQEAHKILEEDHYGLDDIKKRILEFISVGKLSGKIKGSIICLVGPPGVGKTSVGKSIARALNRKFYRFSVGGMHDEAEIKGHRRTYIGAMPGKFIQALKHTQSMNPVIMIDEVDKISASYHGDPASALLEVLDPEQNSEFLDHYLDVRCDLSDILFIVTANVLDTIPNPLKNRMDIMRLSGYIMEEKIEIATRYLIPRHRKLMGLKAKHVTFLKKGLSSIIEGYAREAGVRTLENLIKKILRKLVVQIVQHQEKYKKKKKTPSLSFRITPKTIEEHLGKKEFNSDRYYKKTPPGVCTGLAWTAMGGATLYIETLRVRTERSAMKLTGQAGSVMKESADIAWTFLKRIANNYATDYSFFEKSEVHIHIPEGATPKDGPSAGITMVTALLSLLTNTPVANNVAMTGELTLTGKVLAIGGMKEKIIAAKRSGFSNLIFPKDNVKDYAELPKNITKGITVHFVDYYDEVIKIAFPTGLKKRTK